MKFIDGGRKMVCVFCNVANDVPAEYQQHLDHNNNRVDKFSRPELCRGSYEYKATKDYCENQKQPNPPAIVFCIDVTTNAVKSGMVATACQKIKQMLKSLPKDPKSQTSNMKVAIICYTRVLHFFNLGKNQQTAKQMIVSDVGDIFVPLQDGFLADPNEKIELIESVLDQIPTLFQNNNENESVFAPVLQAANQALSDNECNGKVIVFHSSGLPTAEAPGKLKPHDDAKLLNTNKEHLLWQSADPVYTEIATNKDTGCVANGVSVDLFLFASQHSDVATLTEVSRLTSGNVFRYSYFDADRDSEQFCNDLETAVTSIQAFDCTMRIRTSLGIRPVEFYGNHYMENTVDIRYAAMSEHQSTTVELKHDDKLEAQYCFVQIAILYTTVSGERRIRLHNLTLGVAQKHNDVFQFSNVNTLMSYLLKQAIAEGRTKENAAIKQNLIDKSVNILAAYRKYCSQQSPAGQLILPETLKLLPLYLHSLHRHDVLSSSSNIPRDARAYYRAILQSKDVLGIQNLLYPTVLEVSKIQPLENRPGTASRCRYSKLNPASCYLITNGLNLFLWVGANVDPEYLKGVFNVQNVQQITERVRIWFFVCFQNLF